MLSGLGAPCSLFSVSVEVCKDHCVCDGLLGVLLSCIVGSGVIVGLTGVMFVVLKARGVVTGGVAWALHSAQVQVSVYCLVLVSVVQLVWPSLCKRCIGQSPCIFCCW